MELFDTYLEDGRRSGQTVSEGDPIPQGHYRAEVEVVVRHLDGSHLVTLRGSALPRHPGKWQTGAAGSVRAGETFAMAARRVLEEELAVTGQHLEPIYRAFSPDTQTLCVGFLSTARILKDSISLQNGTAAEYRWLDRKAFLEMVRSGQFVPGLAERLAGYLRNL